MAGLLATVKRPYVASMDEFTQEAKELMMRSPSARFCMKYTGVAPNSKIVLKVTDDESIVKYRTSDYADVKGLVAFQQWVAGHATSQ